MAAIPEGLEIPDKLIDGFVGEWLFSSLLATCCVTVAFCSNMLMVQDRVIISRSYVSAIKKHLGGDK